jgi:tungstate transport system permease protein
MASGLRGSKRARRAALDLDVRIGLPSADGTHPSARFAMIEAFARALALIAGWDQALVEIVGLSLSVSLSAVALATVIGLPLGAVLAIARFPGRAALVVLCNALMGLPPVVAGLVVYLLLSRAGPLGGWGLLFTPAAMVVAQTALVAPIIAALARQVVEDLWAQHRDLILSDGVGIVRAAAMLLSLGAYSLLTAVLAGLGRALAEVGAILIVGGNIAGVTRTMTTAISLETSRGDLPLALGLGVILFSLTLIINATAHLAAQAARRADA